MFFFFFFLFQVEPVAVAKGKKKKVGVAGAVGGLFVGGHLAVPHFTLLVTTEKDYTKKTKPHIFTQANSWKVSFSECRSFIYTF